ncbi:hypothetical protein TNCV_3587711 [Trichonephila clavipes]|nr:hypothetical protein TNCV_3587711 [Trichonephila clavipes]
MKNGPAFRPGILPGRRVNGYKADSSRYFAGIFRPCFVIIHQQEQTVVIPCAVAEDTEHSQQRHSADVNANTTGAVT